MFTSQFFKSRPLLTRGTRSVAFLLVILLLSGCGGEETITNPISGSTGSEHPAPQPSIYFPMTVGSRWVFRNPDSTEWSRETKKFGANLYHFFYYDSPIHDNQSDSLGSPAYVAILDGLVRRINDKDINDAVWQIIL